MVKTKRDNLRKNKKRGLENVSETKKLLLSMCHRYGLIAKALNCYDVQFIFWLG